VGLLIRDVVRPHPWLHGPAAWPWRALVPAALVITFGGRVAWGLAVEPASLLPGDIGQTVALAAAVGGPLLVLSCVPLRWPRALGAVCGLLLVPPGWIPATEWVYETWQLVALAWLTVVAGALLGRLTAPLTAAAWLWTLATPPPSLPVPPPAAAPRPDRPPLVLITLDTFRADHVGRTGEAPFAALTPHLDALAERGLFFSEAVAPAPVTGPSHAGLLSGRFPAEVGVRRNGDTVDDDAELVAEQLHAAGWRTGAFLGSGVLDRRIGLHRGFDHYDDRFGPGHRLKGLPPFDLLRRHRWLHRHRQRAGEQVVARALRWLGDEPRGSFLWVHLYDAHAPYDPELDPDTLYLRAPDRGDRVDVEAWRRWRAQWFRFQGLPMVGRRSVAADLARYAAEIKEVDALVGRLVQALPADAQVVVAADHGESLVEHGYLLNHGRHTFQATVRVPVWVVGDGIPAGVEVHDPAPSWLVGEELRRMADLPWRGPTLRDLTDTAWAEPIESYGAGQEARADFLLGPATPELSVRDGPDKWMIGPWGTLRFDLSTDPGERYPTIEDDDLDWRPRYEDLRSGPELDRQTESWLESLGYTDG